MVCRRPDTAPAAIADSVVPRWNVGTVGNGENVVKATQELDCDITIVQELCLLTSLIKLRDTCYGAHDMFLSP